MAENNTLNTPDFSKPRRHYLRKESNLDACPECNSSLIKHGCTLAIAAKADSDECEFISNSIGSYFCTKCPVVVFDSDEAEKAAAIALNDKTNLEYTILGIVDLKAVPKNKASHELGTDDNPLPLVTFLPELSKRPILANQEPGRNDPCSCGSGKKYKKCCEK